MPEYGAFPVKMANPATRRRCSSRYRGWALVANQPGLWGALRRESSHAVQLREVSVNNVTVLRVDSDVKARRALRITLIARGFAVDEVLCGEKALENSRR